MKLKVKKQFSWAHRGVDVESFEVGDEIDTDDQDLITVAKREKWVTEVKQKQATAADGAEA